MFEHICIYECVLLCSILFLYGFISYIVQCLLVWSLSAHVRLLGDVEIQLIGCLGGCDGYIMLGCVWCSWASHFNSYMKTSSI